MTHSPALNNFLAQPDMENCKLVSYRDGGGVLTIGVGHTGPDVVQEQVITYEQAMTLLDGDLATADRAVNAYIHVPMLQNEYDAMCSLAFNIGSGAFRDSTVARKMNASDTAGAGEAFLMWDKVAGQVSKGLLKRRTSERAMFLNLHDPYLQAYKA